MKINTALILCAGLGKRLNPLTLKTPKPLLTFKNLTMLEHCINMIIKFGLNEVFLNTFHLGDQISQFIKKKKFPIDIKIIQDKDQILGTGGGILNMINTSVEKDFFIFNPDTLWSENYIIELKKMHDFYFLKKLNNILLVTNKELSFDQDLKSNFILRNNILQKKEENNFIYIGCQILNKRLFKNHSLKNFPISEIWDELLKKKRLNGFESLNKFYHLTNLDTFNKLQDL